MSYQEYRPSGFNVLPPVVKNLLIINGIFYLATVLFELKMNIDLEGILGLHYFFSDAFRPYQLVTYMFMHGSFGHIFFNMFALWMFGNTLENIWGAKKFLIYFIVTGIGAALLHYTVHYFEIQPTLNMLNDYIINQDISNFEKMFQPLMQKIHATSKMENLINQYNSIADNLPEKIQVSVELVKQYKIEFLNAPVVVGASGSVFGLLLAFGMMFPNSMIYMYFLFPIKAKWFVIFYGAIELFGAVNPSQGDNIAHYAHLGGMLFGFILIKYWDKNRKHL
ncbi:MAG: rhomboid family intramembrane serine protease [Bacteroidota bacterium]